MTLLFGPVSDASPNGGGPFWNILVIAVALIVLIRVWTKYFDREEGSGEPLKTGDVIGLTVISGIMLAFGVYGLFN